MKQRSLAAATLIGQYAGKGLLLDSNLLLLLVVGNYDRALVSRYKRLSVFAPEDYDILVAVVARFRHLYITPNTTTEVSNLAGGLSGPVRDACFDVLKQTVLASQEMLVSSAEAVTHAAFLTLGITDAAIFRVAGNPPLVLTMDFALAQQLAAEGLPVINFNHIRTVYWT